MILLISLLPIATYEGIGSILTKCKNKLQSDESLNSDENGNYVLQNNIEDGVNFANNNTVRSITTKGIGIIPTKFCEYSSIESFEADAAIQTIEDYAFRNCVNLKTVSIDSATSINFEILFL